MKFFFFINPWTFCFVFVLQCKQRKNVHNWTRRWARCALEALYNIHFTSSKIRQPGKLLQFQRLKVDFKRPHRLWLLFYLTIYHLNRVSHKRFQPMYYCEVYDQYFSLRQSTYRRIVYIIFFHLSFYIYLSIYLES